MDRVEPSVEHAWVELIEARGWRVYDAVLKPDLLNDDELVIDRAVEAADGRRTPLALAGRLSNDQLAEHQERVVALLKRVAGTATRCVLFLNATMIDSNAPDDAFDRFSIPEEFVSLQCCFDDSRMNGTVAIVGVPVRSLGMYRTAIGRADRLRGILTNRSFKEVVASLSLADPLPSTEPEQLLGSRSQEPLLHVLQAGDVFFEEIGNGTKLRLIVDKARDLASLGH